MQCLKEYSVQFLHKIESRNYKALFDELKTVAKMYPSMALNATRDIFVKFFKTDTIGGSSGEHSPEAVSCQAGNLIVLWNAFSISFYSIITLLLL